MSSNPEIGCVRTRHTGKEGKGAVKRETIQEIALNPITSEVTPGGDVYETFREGYRKKKRKEACTDSCRNYGLCGYFERGLPRMVRYGETTKREDVWNP